MLDGLLTTQISSKLNKMLAGAKISKVSLLNKEEIVFNCQTMHKSFFLVFDFKNPLKTNIFLLSKDAYQLENKLQENTFSLILSKHLKNSTLKLIKAQPFERIIYFTFFNKEEVWHLIFEATGKQSNLILSDTKGYIIAAKRHISTCESKTRLILPGIKYQLPKLGDKIEIQKLSQEEFVADLKQVSKEILARGFINNKDFCKEICKRYKGLSPQILSNFNMEFIDEKSFEVNSELKKELIKLHSLFQKETASFCLLKKDNYHFPYLFPLANHEVIFEDLSFLEASQKTYILNQEASNFATLRQKISAFLQKNEKALTKKILLAKNAYEEGQKSQKYKDLGLHILANIHNIKEGDEEIFVNLLEANSEKELAEFLNEKKELKILLNPKLSPAANAEAYFRLYRKKSQQYLSQAKIKVVLQEKMLQINTWQKKLAACSSYDELLDLVEKLEKELKNSKYFRFSELNLGIFAAKKVFLIKEKNAKNPEENKLKISPSQNQNFRTFISSEGKKILVGKNSFENDLIVKKGKNQDLWLHFRGREATHVLLCSAFLSGEENLKKDAGDLIKQKSIKEAAALAAWYGLSANEKEILYHADYNFWVQSSYYVDLCLPKNLYKIKDAKPGLVHTKGEVSILTSLEPLYSLFSLVGKFSKDKL